MRFFHLTLLFALVALTNATIRTSAPHLRGGRSRGLWQTHVLQFKGPTTNELDKNNPFLNYRLDVAFRHVPSGVVVSVPGFYAADGNAGQTGASAGNIWEARFVPSRRGEWSYEASFVYGRDVAILEKGGRPVFFHGATGRFEVGPNPSKAPDLRSKGRLQYVGQRYFRFSNGEYFLKLGTNTPENVLGYQDFDKDVKVARHHFINHTKDWKPGNPTWRGGRGKAIIGAINYLASRGVNSFFAMLMTVKGDSHGDVHPWISQKDMFRFDVSRLAQWQIVFHYACLKGLALNLSFLETENEALFEHHSGISKLTGFAKSRKLFYREMIARFSHNVGFTMTLGEENGWTEEKIHGGGHPWGSGNTDHQRAVFTRYLRDLDPYDAGILVHTFPSLKDEVYLPLLSGHAAVESASLQMGNKRSTHYETLHWLSNSVRAGRPWVVSADEVGGGTRPKNGQKGLRGGIPLERDGTFDGTYRAELAWGNVLAGGAGIELFSAGVDQTLDDFRELDSAWLEFSRVVTLFKRHRIPFWAMENVDHVVSRELVRGKLDYLYALGRPGDAYVIYVGASLRDVSINLSSYSKVKFFVRWYSPRKKESLELQLGSVPHIFGGSSRARFGSPPKDKLGSGRDWVVVISRQIPFRNKASSLTSFSPRDLIPGSLTLGKNETWA